MIFLILFWTFFKIGAFTFGGGYAMLPLIQQAISEHEWMSQEQLVDFIAVSESTPGPFAVNISTYVGTITGGFAGALCATLGVVVPSFIIILIVARYYEKFKTNKIVNGCMSGLRPAVVGMIGSAVISVGQTVFFPSGFVIQNIFNFQLVSSCIIFIIMLILSIKKIHPIIVIGLSAGLGIICGVSSDIFHIM